MTVHAEGRWRRGSLVAATLLSYYHTMALVLDTSRDFRSVEELTQLVKAISEAPPDESEPDWLEWKREGDLKDRKWHARIAKAIAGFANRDPAVASRQAGGCAYLVIGAEPENVAGIKPVDNAELNAGVSRFVRSSVRWNPQYVGFKGQQVLVITVEPPNYGDPITAILTEYGTGGRKSRVVGEGDVFVRYSGSTGRATQDDYDMLVQRYAAVREQLTGITVDAIGTVSAVPVAYGTEEIEAWCLRRKESFPQPILWPGGAILGTPLDDRSISEYMAEVDAYIYEAASLLPQAAHAVAIDDRGAPGMALRLTNGTERNFRAVRVQVVVEGDVFAYLSAEEARPFMPGPPRQWGTLPGPRIVRPPLPLTTETFLSSIEESSDPYIDNSNPTTIVFPDVDLRPSESVKLYPIHLVTAGVLARTALFAKWSATSSSADSVALGEFPIEVSPETVKPAGRLRGRLDELID